MGPSISQLQALGIHTMIDALDERTVRTLLRELAPKAVDGYGTVCVCYEKLIEDERKRKARRKHAGDSWYVLNKKYKSSRGSVEYERAYDAKEEVDAYIASIEKQAHPDTSYGTKKSALETLRRIGKSIMLAPSTLGHEVIKHMQEDDALPNAMISILESMSVDERLRLADSSDEKGCFYDRVGELVADADDLCIFEELSSVVELLDGAVGSEEAGDGGEDGSDGE
ncbi:hypothetical protein LTR65_003970 [Meristemomyces frigidus]